MFTRILFLFIVLVLATPALGESLWDKTKSAAGSAVEIVGETAQDVGKKIKGEEEPVTETRAKINNASEHALERLFRDVPSSRDRYEQAFGYAVFDTRKMSLMITTGFGSGVAVARESGERTYMKMATGGLNLGYGAQYLQIVFLFPDEATFSEFVETGWSAGAEADAVAGQDATDAALRLENGTTVYELNEKGAVLSVTLTGTKYWKDDELNL